MNYLEKKENANKLAVEINQWLIKSLKADGIKTNDELMLQHVFDLTEILMNKKQCVTELSALRQQVSQAKSPLKEEGCVIINDLKRYIQENLD